MALLPRLNHQHNHRKKTRNKRLLPSKIFVCFTSVFVLVVFLSSESFTSLKRERFKVFSISPKDKAALKGFGKGQAFTKKADEENEGRERRTFDDDSLERERERAKRKARLTLVTLWMNCEMMICYLKRRQSGLPHP